MTLIMQASNEYVCVCVQNWHCLVAVFEGYY